MLQLILLGVVSGLLSWIYYWAHQRQNYCKNRNIPHIKSLPLLGHFFKTVLLKESNVNAISNLYNHPNARGNPFVGINVFHKPAILIREPELVKRVLIKDFQFFANRHVGVDPIHDPMSGLNLFQIKNPRWKDLRVKLSPVFTSAVKLSQNKIESRISQQLNENTSYLFNVVNNYWIHYWAHQRQNYWKNRNIPHIKSLPLLGHFFKTVLLKESNVNAISNLYNHPNARGNPFVGINVFHKPAILIREPELVKRVLIKDFQFFANRHVGVDPIHDPMSGLNLFQIKNPRWKDLRVKLSPAFTSGKMKQMFYMVENVGNVLSETIANLIKNGKPAVEIRTLLARYTIDSICIVAFGTDSGCLKDPETSEFLKEAKSAFQVRYIDKVAGHLLFFLSEFMKIFNMKSFNPSFEKILRRLFDEVMTSRMQNGGNRNDLIDALIALKKAEIGTENTIFSKDVLVAQAAAFFFAGFETSASTMEFFFYQIAKHPEIQANIRNEIREAMRKHGKISYELIANDLPYVTAAIKETLRLYPILPFLDRECELQKHQNGYSMEPYSSFKIPNGMPVYIPIYNLQRDPEYFPDPEKFIPERFLSTTNEFLWMPFGTGPRNCIGERFAMMQMKVAIVSLLTSFRLEFTPETPKNIQLDSEKALLHSDGGILLKFVSDPQ